MVNDETRLVFFAPNDFINLLFKYAFIIKRRKTIKGIYSTPNVNQSLTFTHNYLLASSKKMGVKIHASERNSRIDLDLWITTRQKKSYQIRRLGSAKAH